MSLARLMIHWSAVFAAGALPLLAGLIAMAAIAWPGPIRAQPTVAVQCEATPVTQYFTFGAGVMVNFQVRFSCANFSTTSDSGQFQVCLGEYAGTQHSPARRRLGAADGTYLDYNLYIDRSMTEWTSNTPAKSPIIDILPGDTYNGVLDLFGVIISGQNVPVGNYTGYINNARIGIVVGQNNCQLSSGGIYGGVGRLEFNATNAPSCALGTIGAIDFGNQPGLFDYADAAGAVRLTCPLDIHWALRFDGGQNQVGDIRRMRSAADEYLPYTLYSDLGRNTPIPIDQDSIEGIGTGTEETRPIYGRVEPHMPPAPGLYQDAIVVTLSF